MMMKADTVPPTRAMLLNGTFVSAPDHSLAFIPYNEVKNDRGNFAVARVRRCNARSRGCVTKTMVKTVNIIMVRACFALCRASCRAACLSLRSSNCSNYRHVSTLGRWER
jgi:hypothetical protein